MAVHRTREYAFTVVYEPVDDGFQVSVPSLTGLVTYGRTFDEAREMARDAIRCHVQALRAELKRYFTEWLLNFFKRDEFVDLIEDQLALKDGFKKELASALKSVKRQSLKKFV